MYKQYKKIDGSLETFGIQRLIDMTFIPFAEENTDYQEYLKWVSEGNTPLPADE